MSQPRPRLSKVPDSMPSHLSERLLHRAWLEATKLPALWHRLAGTFDDVETYCMFIGNSRSGHSLVGALLDAHPNMIIAHELDALQYIEHYNVKKYHLYYLLLRNSVVHARRGRRWLRYSYRVKGQWQGRHTGLKVVGDKKGGRSSQRLAANPGLLDGLAGLVGDDTAFKIIHVVRNPFDNIGSKFSRRPRPLDVIIDEYFGRCGVVRRVMGRLGDDVIITVRSEDVIRQPERELGRLCDFLGVGSPESYLSACAAIVYDNPHKARSNVDWDAESVDKILARIDEFDFLRGYTFEN